MFQNYQVPFTKDRIVNYFGGVIVYVKAIFLASVDGVKCIWLELTLRNKTVLFSVFYRTPNYPAQTLVDIAFDTNIGNIVTGDFNLNCLDSDSKCKISSVFDQYNLVQLIREHFTENFLSLIYKK